MRGPDRTGALVSGHHRAHLGFWKGKEEETIIGNGKYVLCKSSKALASISDAMIILNRDAAFDIQYRIRETALNHSLKKEKITPEQYRLRMIKLEESMAVHSYQMGEYDANTMEELNNQFEGRKLSC